MNAKPGEWVPMPHGTIGKCLGAENKRPQNWISHEARAYEEANPHWPKFQWVDLDNPDRVPTSEELYVAVRQWIDQNKANEQAGAQNYQACIKPPELVEKFVAITAQIGGDHYKKLKIQPVEYIHANQIPFIEGSIIKYITRWRDKGGVADLEKAKHFIDLLIGLEARSK